MSDPELPITTFPVRVEGADLNNAVSSGSLDRGHLTAFRDRDRNAKDAIATFLTTNLIPQNTQNNTLNSAWENFESYLENTLVGQGRNVYVTAGGYYNPNQTRLVVNNTIVDENGDFVLDANNRIKTGTPNDLKDGQSLRGRTNPKQIAVPDFTWKIAVVLNPGQQLTDINSNTQVIAIITPNKQTPPGGGGSIQLPNQPLPIAASKWSYWPYWRVDVNYLEEIIGYDFFSNLPDEIEQVIESDNYSPLVTPFEAAPLLADSEFISFSNQPISFGIGGGDNSTIGQDGVIHVSTESSSFLSSILEVSTSHGSFHSITVPKVSPSEIGFIQKSHAEIGSFQVGISENSPPQVGTEEKGSSKISPFEIDFFKTNLFQIGSTQVNPTKISLPSSITLQQLLTSHDSYLQNTTVPAWTDFIQTLTPFGFKLEVSNLPTGQLSEAQITKYDSFGRPIGGTILIDTDANGKGWFIDPTPFDNSEFTNNLSDTAYSASADSAAFGHYDLLTAILHEMGHLAGFISGYSEFDRHIQTLNGSNLFITADGINAAISGDHLDPKLYPYDLFSPVLTPGMRKLPSLLDAQLLAAIGSSNEDNGNQSNTAALNAPLTSTPLSAKILNGTFDSTNPTNPNYGWSTRGDSEIVNGQAILGESDRLNANFSQSFTIPEGAKYLQFTLLDTQLGASTKFDPTDAFEVALLDASTLAPLAGTATRLTQTDALLNIQHDGTAYLSPLVTLKGSTTTNGILPLGSPMTFTVDVSNIAPGTEAKLYFVLLTRQ